MAHLFSGLKPFRTSAHVLKGALSSNTTCIWRKISSGKLLSAKRREINIKEYEFPLYNYLPSDWKDYGSLTVRDVEEVRSKLDNSKVRGSLVAATDELEKKLWDHGYKGIIGVDEVGRGAAAGPLVLAACIIQPNTCIPNVYDSKMISESQPVCSQFVPSALIDEVGIDNATIIGINELLNSLKDKWDYVFLDGRLTIRSMNRGIISNIRQADYVSASVAAASILAKVSRDRFLSSLHQQAKYEVYGFHEHKGYPSIHHKRMIQKYGYSDEHRKSFNLSLNIR